MTGFKDECKRCASTDPLRSIQMMDGAREVLCESCFEEALDAGEVHPADPRLT